MKKLLVILLVLSLMAVTAVVTAQIIPPLTLTKKTVVIRNIENCAEGRSTLVGRGAFNPEKMKHRRYVCRPLVKETGLKPYPPFVCPDPTGCSHATRTDE